MEMEQQHEIEKSTKEKVVLGPQWSRSGKTFSAGLDRSMSSSNDNNSTNRPNIGRHDHKSSEKGKIDLESSYKKHSSESRSEYSNRYNRDKDNYK